MKRTMAAVKESAWTMTAAMCVPVMMTLNSGLTITAASVC